VDWLWGSTQGVLGALSPEVKWLGHEADHSPPASAKVKKIVDLYIHSPIQFHGECFVKHRDNFTLLKDSDLGHWPLE
jgi:hypothetical protein